jgi:MoxR-like ATPase
MALSDLTSREAVESALDEFDVLGRDAFLEKYGFGRSRRYFVQRDGNHYDSKPIVGAAVGYEHPENGPLLHTEFSGGEHATKAKLEQLGFKVVAKPALAAADTLPLRDALDAGLRAQRERTQAGWSDDLQKMIAVTLPNAIRDLVGQDFRVKGSAGAGNQAEIPWVSIMPPELKGASEGRYVVYLFAADGERVFLALSQAVTGQPKRSLTQLAEQLREEAGAQPDLLERIDLGAEGQLGERYALATAYALEYRSDALPSADDLERDLHRFLAVLDVVSQDDRAAADVVPTAWIFQANPSLYDIDRALKQLPEIEWTVRQHRKRVRAGDKAYIWRSGPLAGIVAEATVATDPAESGPDPAEDPYYIQREAFSKVEPRVTIKIDRVLDEPLLREVLRNDPVLKGLRILHFANATVHEVKPPEEQRLQELLAGGETIRATPIEPFTVSSIIEAATREPRRLRLDDEIYSSVFAALESGKHVVLTGPPGTAKTTLAEAVAEAAANAGRCSGHVLTTATADWTTYETIGGLKPTTDNQLIFAPGHFLEAIEHDKWLVIDELNRSNFDRAFGQLFTVLSGQAVQLPYARAGEGGRPLTLVPEGAPVPPGVDVLAIPASWRVIATMNVFDKSLLFEMSFALMRRFAFIEVPSPPDPVFEDLISAAADGDAEATALTLQFLPLRQRKDLGPALFMDMARYLSARRGLDDASPEQLAFEVFYGFLLPQFEGVDEVEGERLFKQVRRIVGRGNEARLRKTLQSVLGLELVFAPERTLDNGVEPADFLEDSVEADDLPET